MSADGRTFRVFVSSTFSDLVAERNALNERVWPKLRALCEPRGARFHAIDLRWGVSEEAGRDQKTMTMCLSEIARCQDVSPRPNFVILLGDRYGWRPLPPRLLASEFDALARQIPSDVSALAECWYELDENADPPERILVERPQDVDGDAWNVIERRLREAFVLALPACGLDVMDPRLNGASATEQEIAAGALAVEDAKDHVVVVFREIEGLSNDASAREFVDLLPGGRIDTQARDRLDGLKRAIEVKLGRKIEPVRARRSGTGLTEAHLESVCAAVEKQLTDVITRELERIEAEDPLDAETRRHRGFCKERAKHFVGRKAELDAIASYLAGAAPHPLVVQGESGCGKSALLARAAQTLVPAGAMLLLRFIGATPASSDGRALLDGLLAEIARMTGGEAPPKFQDARELERAFEKTLARLPDGCRLVVFLDALDQLSPEGQAWHLLWLPSKLPAHVRIVVSVTPGEQFAWLGARMPEAAFLDVRPLASSEASEALSLG